MLRRVFFYVVPALVFIGCCSTATPDKQHVYIISTNDIHANIDAMPRLMTLVKEYEMQGDVLLVDAGDRVSGNAFVDDAPCPGLPIIELMNVVGYDVVTLGNHEFDNGSGALRDMVASSQFKTICANVDSSAKGVDFEPYAIVNVAGIDIGFVGVVGIDYGGRPLGGEAAYRDFTFTSDVDAALEWCITVDEKCDFVALLSHMGLDSDRAFAQRTTSCNWVVGGHTHDIAGERCSEVYISQNRKSLDYVTVADIEVVNGEVASVSHVQRKISSLAPDADVAQQVARLKGLNPELARIEGRVTAMLTHDGVANFTVAALANYDYIDNFIPEISFYHIGGVRLTSIPEGDISRGDIYNNDPFRSTIYIGEMTPKQMRRFILDKYNSGTAERPDKESHYVYFYSDRPYTIIVGEDGDAVDVVFDLEERMYRVAMCNYIAENYIDKHIVEEQLSSTDVSVREAMISYLHTFAEGLAPDNDIRQSEVFLTSKK